MRSILNHWTTEERSRPAIPPQATSLRSVEPGDSRESVDDFSTFFPIMYEISAAIFPL